MVNWDTLLAELATPVLPGARCRGRHELFDAAIGDGRGALDERDYARQAAARICRQCPALASCREWFDSLPHEQRPLGVTAAVVVNSCPPRKTRGLTTKDGQDEAVGAA
ncbi:Uncharacterised protein [Mycobacteroides abscessus subsp. abscessus]|nr:Uncharacterised protein [Mycobacteroides abscessus subsp. abscessus]SHR27556.1 Uncharacterised protein [Mycobacteroides abscessus subsp. abscessus]SHR94763.1 Uncharacterised protein [Mycobacteroides abscessus subsp. abscessus]SHT60363.1 Uncharacterised protein [Mycobacteroides abscessus subsp. abscessus]